MRRKGLIYEGVTQSLRRFQDEVNEVRAGMECGIRIDGFNDFQVGDAIECYTLEESRKNSSPGLFRYFSSQFSPSSTCHHSDINAFANF